MDKLDIKGYELLDSGKGRKLERVGKFKIVRQAPQAVWDESSPNLWKGCDAVFTRLSGGEGSWKINNLKVKEGSIVEVLGSKIKLCLTDFGHIGMFPEQFSNWKKLTDLDVKGIEVLNLFAYTGIFSTLLAKKKASVTHLDASKTSIAWAKENAGLNSISSIRWILDDAIKFLKREARRSKKYQGIILDPPSFGRGAKGEVFKIEDEIVGLLNLVLDVFDDKKGFILLSSHSSGFTPKVLYNLLYPLLKERGISGSYSYEEMIVNASKEYGSVDLPCGSSCLFLSKTNKI